MRRVLCIFAHAIAAMTVVSQGVAIWALVYISFHNHHGRVVSCGSHVHHFGVSAASELVIPRDVFVPSVLGRGCSMGGGA